MSASRSIFDARDGRRRAFGSNGEAGVNKVKGFSPDYEQILTEYFLTLLYNKNNSIRGGLHGKEKIR
ncbi:MAG: hypothetical protein QGD96_02335 [Anaerolineae bacterium]|nr:hypothetical protein [Anaerolineae bacterium]